MNLINLLDLLNLEHLEHWEPPWTSTFPLPASFSHLTSANSPGAEAALLLANSLLLIALLGRGRRSLVDQRFHHTYLHEGAKWGARWTQIQCCSLQGSVHLQAVSLQRSNAAGLPVCLGCLEFLPSLHLQWISGWSHSQSRSHHTDLWWECESSSSSIPTMNLLIFLGKQAWHPAVNPGHPSWWQAPGQGSQPRAQGVGKDMQPCRKATPRHWKDPPWVGKPVQGSLLFRACYVDEAGWLHSAQSISEVHAPVRGTSCSVARREAPACPPPWLKNSGGEGCTLGHDLPQKWIATNLRRSPKPLILANYRPTHGRSIYALCKHMQATSLGSTSGSACCLLCCISNTWRNGPSPFVDSKTSALLLLAL